MHSTEAESPQEEHDDDDQPDEVDKLVHLDTPILSIQRAMVSMAGFARARLSIAFGIATPHQTQAKTAHPMRQLTDLDAAE